MTAHSRFRVEVKRLLVRLRVAKYTTHASFRLLGQLGARQTPLVPADFATRFLLKFAGAVLLQANAQQEKMKNILRADLDRGVHGLVEAVLKDKVKARLAVLGAKGGARNK